MSSIDSSLQPSLERTQELREALSGIRQRVAIAAASSRQPTLVAVSKYKPASDILACFEQSHLDFGENYVQELVDKASLLPREIRWHFIGTLQSNKAKTLASIPNLHCIQTLTSTKAASALNKALPTERASPLHVLLQVNTSGEDNKSGLPPLGPDTDIASTELSQLATFIVKECPKLRLEGLMTIGSLEQSLNASKSEKNLDFEKLRETSQHLADYLTKEHGDGQWGHEATGKLLLSMGMSSDFEAALKSGSDIVRVGTGVTYPGWQPYNTPTGQTSIERPYSTYDPIMSATASTMACNDNGQASAAQLSASVPAGSQITAKWSQWTHAEGPVTVYMAKCNGSCTSSNSNSLKWFKISETGLKSGTVGAGKWGLGDVMATLSYTATIPASLAAGEYLIRHELLALHQANTPQWYPECAQLTVTGGGGKTPSGSYLVSFPGAYSASDPSININIYADPAKSQTTYKVPGPAVWNGQ
ncbi:hypothetical protein NP233_g8808 [Leucocoprinus birnbaumii]|uniref:Pyridoxal phosphate homeostasis protein n=1 Tax=Leucocoprinus birnbaumii TaxID=56174 RepID=A0AAD5VP18_9AGAR|nr:hypothetical protein NP233_g8808 [Leucocoprinus birnbaumii]